MGNKIAAQRHWIVKETAELNQHRYLQDVLILKWKSENLLHRGGGYAFVSTENERPWINLRLIGIRFDMGRPHGILDYRHKEIKQKKISLCGNSSDIRQKCCSWFSQGLITIPNFSSFPNDDIILWK